MRSAACHDGFQPSSFKSSDGLLWFATIHGMVMVDPRKVGARAVPIRRILRKSKSGRLKEARTLAPKPGAISEFVSPSRHQETVHPLCRSRPWGIR